MLSKKNFLSSILVLAFPVVSFGSDLTITNHTNYDSTSRINNNKFCSNQILGADGVTKAHSTKVIKQWQINLACATNLENCKADVYMTNNCGGNVIATVIFSTKTGIKSAVVTNPAFSITHSPFSITLTQK